MIESAMVAQCCDPNMRSEQIWKDGFKLFKDNYDAILQWGHEHDPEGYIGFDFVANCIGEVVLPKIGCAPTDKHLRLELCVTLAYTAMLFKDDFTSFGHLVMVDDRMTVDYMISLSSVLPWGPSNVLYHGYIKGDKPPEVTPTRPGISDYAPMFSFPADGTTMMGPEVAE